MMFAISDSKIDPAALKTALQQDGAGACVTFEGWVRDHNEGQAVTRLDYEAYTSMAEKEGRKILEEARAKFPITSARSVHRVGNLSIGECAVWVGVASAHRAAAFDACRYIIDEVKARVPIWKKEHYATGDSGWVNCHTIAHSSPTA